MKGANYLHLTASAYVGSVMLMLMSKCEPAQTAINFSCMDTSVKHPHSFFKYYKLHHGECLKQCLKKQAGVFCMNACRELTLKCKLKC